MKTRRNRKRKTRRGGLFGNLFGPSSSEKADKEADIILADSSKATEIIRSPYTNLEKLRQKILEKGTEQKIDGILKHIDYEMKARRYNALQSSWI